MVSLPVHVRISTDTYEGVPKLRVGDLTRGFACAVVQSSVAVQSAGTVY